MKESLYDYQNIPLYSYTDEQLEDELMRREVVRDRTVVLTNSDNNDLLVEIDDDSLLFSANSKRWRVKAKNLRQLEILMEVLRGTV